MASAIAVVGATAFLPGAGLGSSAAAVHSAQEVPAGLAAAIHARLGVGLIRSADSPTEHPGLGSAVALSADGSTALVSAPWAGNHNGAVYIYHAASAGSWSSSSTPAATLSGALHGQLGVEIALSADGTTAFVGNAGTLAGPHRPGAVYVYHVSSENAWASTSTPTATLTADTGALFGLFGFSVAASADGTTVVAGEPFGDAGAGEAEVYHVSSENAWVSSPTPSATLTAAAQSNSEQVGFEVAMSGDGTTVLLSNHLSRTPGAYVFHVPSETAWSSSSAPTATLSNASGGEQGRLGVTLALSTDGTTAFLAEPGANGYRGAVDVFHVAGEGAWASSSTPAAILTNGAAAADEFLGSRLAVSIDGRTVVAGAPGFHRSAGAAYVFHASGEGAWKSSTAPTAALTDSRGVRNDGLGGAVASAADGATVLIGAPGVNWSTGKADVFHATGAGSWVNGSTPNAKLTNAALPKPRCVVPHLAGEQVAYVKGDLEDANCRLGKVRKVHSSRRHKGKVVAQSPAARRNLRPGSKVNVKIGK